MMRAMCDRKGAGSHSYVSIVYEQNVFGAMEKSQWCRAREVVIVS